MDLPWLEELLGVKYDPQGSGLVLPQDAWDCIKKEIDPDDGTTLLMRAARDGTTECVELLLRCGVDVNENRYIDGEYCDDDVPRRALDFAVDEGNWRIVEILLRWDSILPDSDELKEKFEETIDRDEGIKKVFSEREELLKSGDISAIEERLNREDATFGRENRSGPRYWVDCEGGSMLLAAALQKERHEVWAFLRSRNFEFLEKEAGIVESYFRDEGQRCKFDLALGKYFVEVEDSHVYKLMSRTRVRGAKDETRSKILKIYQDANKVPEARLLMQCLQDYPHFEVVFDLERSDIACVYSQATAEVRGVMDARLDRVYASACLEPYSDVVSNLIHEFCHRVLDIVFRNHGLPYTKSDHEKEIAYRNIFSDFSEGNFEKCNEIIQRVGYYSNHQLQELIVRVPEIITKHTLEKHVVESGPWSNDEEKNLYTFYSTHVVPEIEKVIAANKVKPCIPIVDLLSHPGLLSKHRKQYAQVDKIKEPDICFHHDVRFLQVSNLTLGVSHLEKSFDNIVVVDWSVFLSSKTYFNSQLGRGYFDNLAVVWDKGKDSAFCDKAVCCVKSCPAHDFRNYAKCIIVLVPKEFNTRHESKPIGYSWENLAEETKVWILERRVCFQGRDVLLRDMILSVVGNEDVDSKFNALIGDDDLSVLIDRETCAFGRDLLSELAERRTKLMRGHPDCYIPRRKRVRAVNFREKCVQKRINDAVIVLNAEESDLRDVKVDMVRLWDGAVSPSGGTRHFVVNEDVRVDLRLEYCKNICHELRCLPASGNNWRFAHFFHHKEKNFVHVYSQRIDDPCCEVIADEPGCGKSVYANKEAEEGKLEHPERWIEVVLLTDHENAIQKWSDSFSTQSGDVKNFLQLLIRESESKCVGLSLEQKMFDLFCQAKGMVRVYFDGFDEICPRYKKQFSSFLAALLRQTNVSFVVTTRTNERFGLEELLSTLSYSLAPFDKKEQILFLNREWNATLNSLSEELLKEKLKAIANKCESKKELRTVVDEIESLIQGADLSDLDINFSGVAEALLEKDRARPSTDGYFSEIPLHAWMLAAVSFEDDLFVDDSVNLSFVYKRFVDLKIKKVYLEEKAKERGLEAGDALRDVFFASIWRILKNFSASYFLEDARFMPKDVKLDSMLRVGLAVKRESKFEFTHLTFGEYLFSCWLLKMTVSEVRKMSEGERRSVLQKVLLESQFASVRKFFDGLLLAGESEIMGLNGLERAAEHPSIFREGKEHANASRKCFHMAIKEGHEGILHYLAEICKRFLSTVMFVAMDIDRVVLDKVREEYPRCVKYQNALTLCGAIIVGSFDCSRVRLLRALLMIAETYNLLGDLRKYVSKQGLWWMGIDRRHVWANDNSLKELRSMFDFLLDHKETFKSPLKASITDAEHTGFYIYASIYDARIIERLLDAILVPKDLQKLLAPSWLDRPEKSTFNLISAWIAVIMEKGVSEVENMWNYLKSRLLSEERIGRAFLHRKDRSGRNCLVAAVCNTKDLNVIRYVWGIIKKECFDEDAKQLVFESFVDVSTRTRLNIYTDTFVCWLELTKQNEFLLLDEILNRVLLVKNKCSYKYLKIYDKFSSYSLYKIQAIIAESLREKSRERGSEGILDHMKGHYEYLVPSCIRPLKNSCPLPGSMIHGEFLTRILPFLMSTGLVQDVALDEHNNVCGLNGVSADGLMKWLVILWRQLELESFYFTVDELTARLRTVWYGTYVEFPMLRVVGEDDFRVKTRSFFIPYFFSLLLRFLPKEQVTEVLVNGIQPLLLSLLEYEECEEDLLSFLALYDVLRLCIGEDALWKIHSIHVYHGTTLLTMVLKSQERGYYEGRMLSTQDILKRYAVEKYGHARLHSLKTYCESVQNYRDAGLWTTSFYSLPSTQYWSSSECAETSV
ncbi:uncharacterized protein LOC124169677 [Ischnura elegans]|uniref:uncharacterized protein LOC124169677 n=1 Tax=Ischnura elegans TaxID=197161 RepID=UPI001ED8AC41|nr:uncharacterized protein LOC124169677 [Ischnura elegans]